MKRPLSFHRLLDREPIPVETPGTEPAAADLSVLVTGAGGSIGSELARGLLAAGVSRLYLLDTSERDLFWIHRELAAQYPSQTVSAVLGSVCDAQLLEHVFADGEFDLVVHAAAYKHVSLVRKNRLAAIRVNVLGTRRVLHAASATGVGRLLAVSTDKAVEPASVMGLTKRAAERLIGAHSGPTKAASVRFGNVLGSSGSLLPIFDRDWAESGRIEVRDGEASRYFLTPEEVRGLLLAVCGMIDGGEVFVLRTGDPVRVLDLARRFLKERGCSDPDARIDLTALLPEEKLEEALWKGPEPEPTRHPNILRTREPAPDPATQAAVIEALERACKDRDEAVAMNLLHRLADC
jgi:FlaA1/EpsC-like NDP-sugar epimerase